MANQSKDESHGIIVSYDHDHRWIVEVPVASEDGQVELEFAWFHYPYPQPETRAEAVELARMLAKQLKLSVQVFNRNGIGRDPKPVKMSARERLVSKLKSARQARRGVTLTAYEARLVSLPSNQSCKGSETSWNSRN